MTGRVLCNPTESTSTLVHYWATPKQMVGPKGGTTTDAELKVVHNTGGGGRWKISVQNTEGQQFAKTWVVSATEHILGKLPFVLQGGLGYVEIRYADSLQLQKGQTLEALNITGGNGFVTVDYKTTVSDLQCTGNTDHEVVGAGYGLSCTYSGATRGALHGELMIDVSLT